MKTKKSILLKLFLLLGGLIPVSLVHATDGIGLKECQSQVESRLQDKGLLQSLKLFHRGEVLSGRDNDSVTGYEYWYKHVRCVKGSLVVTTNENCHNRQIYTRQGCVLPGIRYSNW